MINENLFTSGNNEYCTPDFLIKYFGDFDLDLCCTPLNKVCRGGCYDLNHLKMDYYGKIWCNPPYSTKLQDLAVEKCVELALFENEVYLLIPCRMNSKRFEKLLKSSTVESIYFPNRRIKFKGCSSSAPFDCMIIHLSAYTKFDHPVIKSLDVDSILCN